MSQPTQAAGPRVVRAEVVSVRAAGRHHRVTLRVPDLTGFRPGAFVSVAVGPEPRVHLARRSLWIHRLVPAGSQGGTLDVLVEPRGFGTHWLAAAPPGTEVPLVGPLGRPFALPADAVTCLLVGESRAAAPLFPLAERLRERGSPVHVLLAGDDASDVVSAHDLRRVARSVTVVTRDGSIGRGGSVVDALPEALASTGADVVYAASASHSTLHAVALAAEQHGVWSQVALETPQPCGTGLCGGCAVPVVGEDGVARTVRGCIEGPVFRGDRVRWVDL